MPRFGVISPAIILALSAAGLLSAQPNPDPPGSVNATLAIQNTLNLARQALSKGEIKQAVTMLESNLHIINGNSDYLATLRQAYEAYSRLLQREGRELELKQVQERLRIIDPKANAANVGATTASSDDDPFQQLPKKRHNSAELLKNGAQAFSKRQYAEAAKNFESAYALDPNCLGEHRGSWAYCRLNRVIEQLNDSNRGREDLAGLDQEIRDALSLASDKPQLAAFARQVHERLRERLRPGATRATAPESSDVSPEWQLAESTNFRVLHRHAKEFAERVLAVAEETRTAQFEKWFGPPPSSWTPRCDIFIYASAGDYMQATRQGSASPGHSTVEINDGKVSRRRLDLVGNQTNLLIATLPHEVTHVVIADLFPNPLLPRWADEAMAILAEPRSQIDRYLRVLPRCKQERTLFDVSQLLPMNEFPEAKRITSFYCQSVALVDMLVKEKDARTFAMFLRSAQRYGYEKALERSYGIRSYSELQRKLLARIQ